MLNDIEIVHQIKAPFGKCKKHGEPMCLECDTALVKLSRQEGVIAVLKAMHDIEGLGYKGDERWQTLIKALIQHLKELRS